MLLGRKGEKLVMLEKPILWKYRKRTIFGLPLSFTKYFLYEDRLVVSKGAISIVDGELMLFRVLDFQVKISFWQRIFRVGTVVMTSSDSTHKEFELTSIKQPREMKDLISNKVIEQRKKHGVRSLDKISDFSDEG